MRHLNSILIFIVLIYLYYVLSEVRVYIYDSDIYRNIYEFYSTELSDYNLREPIYWIFGKRITLFTGEGWETIFIIDDVSFFLLYFSEKKISNNPVSISIFLSPLFVLGICNIHRQLVAFCVWIFVVSRTNRVGIGPIHGLHIVPFLIHNSLGILSAIYFVSVFIGEKNWKLLVAIGFVFVTSLLIFGENLAAYFREGTDTNTSLSLYLGWSLIALLVSFWISGWSRFIMWFGILGVGLGTLLFVVSGGSSGSRFFMLVVSALAFWMLSVPRVSRGGLGAFGVQLLLSVVLVAPTLGSSFSRDILVAAYKRIPYGVAI